MTEQEKNEILKYAIAVSFLIDNVECVLEDYEYEGELSEKTIINIKAGVQVVKQMEKGFKKVLGIE